MVNKVTFVGFKCGDCSPGSTPDEKCSRNNMWSLRWV